MKTRSIPVSFPSLLLVALVGCTRSSDYAGAFDLPSAAAVLPVAAGALSAPVGYVADRNGGRVTPLDLRQGLFLPDATASSFGAASPLALGRARVITAVAPWTDGERVDLFAADQAFSQLVRVPHITGRDANNLPTRPSVSWEVVQAPAGVTLDAVTVTAGATSSETFTLQREADAWSITGTRSGRLETLATSGVAYTSADVGLGFTITGDAEPGAKLSLATDAGLTEYDLGGAPEALLASPDASRLAVVWHDDALSASLLGWWDPSAEVMSASLLPDGAHPGRMAFAGDTLYVADRELAVVWSVDVADAVTAHAVPGPTSDVAPLTDGLVYALAADERTVYAFDPLNDALVDVNPAVSGTQSLRFDAPVAGLAAIDAVHAWPEINSAGAALQGRSVAVSLSTGGLQFIEADTSCLMQSSAGPYTKATSGTSDYSTNIASYRAADGYPYFVTSPDTGVHIELSRCGGLVRSETWTVTYRQNLAAWEVSGTLSGPQTGLAYNNQRYLSDDGAISFTMRSGALALHEGWAFSFVTVPGVMTADGTNANSSGRTSLTLPGDPLFFEASDSTGLVSPYVLVTAQGADMAARINPSTGLVDAEWW